MTRPTRLWFSGCLVAACAFAISASFSSADAVRAGQPGDDAPLGISKTKPESKPFVEIDGGYMVPYTVTIPGTEVSFEMVPVPGGTVTMGSPESEPNRSEDEGPQVAVKVGPMWVAKTEVTWAQYKQYMGMYSIFKKFDSNQIRSVSPENMVDAVTAPTELYDPSFTFEYGEDPQQPAVTMTQFAAKQYTKWLSKLTGEQYRLPTEAEWEHAARAGTTTAYSWGDDPEKIEEYAWYFDNSYEGPQQVGKKKPNPWGLYDMHGNAAEWTIDAYTEEGYAKLAGKGPLTVTEAVQWAEEAYPRTVRGGSWEMDAEDLRSAWRLGSDDEEWKFEDPNIPLSPWWFTSDPARGVGFRVFRSLEPMPEEVMVKFWEIDNEDIRFDVESRIQEGRGVLGVVGPELPAAIKKANSN